MTDVIRDEPELFNHWVSQSILVIAYLFIGQENLSSDVVIAINTVAALVVSLVTRQMVTPWTDKNEHLNPERRPPQRAPRRRRRR